MFHWDRDEQQPRSETYHDQPYRFGLQPRSSHPFPSPRASTPACSSCAAESATGATFRRERPREGVRPGECHVHEQLRCPPVYERPPGRLTTMTCRQFP